MVNDKIVSRFQDDPPKNWSVGERSISTGSPLYAPEEVLAMLSDSASIRPSTKDCIEDIQSLELDNDALAQLVIKAINFGRYRKSVWCRLNDKAIAACDDYVVMDRVWNDAAYKELDCEMYLKFAINNNGKLLLMVSCHPST